MHKDPKREGVLVGSMAMVDFDDELGMLDVLSGGRDRALPMDKYLPISAAPPAKKLQSPIDIIEDDEEMEHFLATMKASLTLESVELRPTTVWSWRYPPGFPVSA